MCKKRINSLTSGHRLYMYRFSLTYGPILFWTAHISNDFWREFSWYIENMCKKIISKPIENFLKKITSTTFSGVCLGNFLQNYSILYLSSLMSWYLYYNCQMVCKITNSDCNLYYLRIWRLKISSQTIKPLGT